jgi:TonB family protein
MAPAWCGRAAALPHAALDCKLRPLTTQSFMHSYKTRTILCVCWFWALVSCATPQPATSHLAPPADISAQTPRKLPKSHFDLSAGDPYPEQGKRQGLAGRVLVEFQIDRHGKAVSEKILGADAAPVLQNGALAVVRRSTFDVSGPAFDPADPTPFRVTVRFCLPTCGEVVPFPGTEDITISGSPLR